MVGHWSNIAIKSLPHHLLQIRPETFVLIYPVQAAGF